MSRKSKGNQRRRQKKRHAQVSVSKAPTMNNMQQVDRWTLYDLVPVFATTGDVTQPVVLQIEAGTNGWNYLLTQAGTAVGNRSALYGALTGQFAQLAQVWQTFRLDGVMLEFTPSNFAGSGNGGPMASVVDAAGLVLPQVGGGAIGDVIERFSRSRTLDVKYSAGSCRRMINYQNWLVQTVSEPFLLTQDGQGSDGRQLYPDQFDNQRTPVIRMAAQYISPVQGQLVGLIRVCARYQVRGRRLDPLNTESIRKLMQASGITLEMMAKDLAI